MKKAIIALLTLCAVTVTSCDFLDVVPEEFTTDEQIWSDVRNAEKALARFYNVLYESCPNDMWAASDECKHHWETPGIWVYNNGSWGPTRMPTINSWDGRYRDIRRGALLIANLADVPIIPLQQTKYETQIPLYIAESRFLRCYYYFDLFSRWGPVPLVIDPISPEDIDGLLSVEIPRATLDEFKDFMLSELELAEEVFEKFGVIKYGAADVDYGRATKAAVLALRSRFLLYLASPLYNGNTLYADIKNPDGTQIFPQGYDKERWREAMDAAREYMNLEGIHNLAYYDDGTNFIMNYAEQFYEANPDETVFCKIKNDYGTDVEKALFPNGQVAFRGNGKYSVSQELIDSYEMANGYPINEPGSGYNPNGTFSGEMWDGATWVTASNVSNMYKSRDPRFYASIFFHRGVWKYSSAQRAIHYSYFGGNTDSDIDGWPKRGTNCESGYNIRKWCNPAVDFRNTASPTSRRNYPIFRFAEAYLNFAEARNEYLDVPDQEVYEAINKVRARVGMPPLPIIPSDYTKDGMRERIRNERRVEFAFEYHRFYDVRRWMIAEVTDNRPIHGLNAQPSEAELAASGYTPSSREAGEAVFYKVVELQNRVFEKKHYLFPIPQDEMDRCPFITQNYGWEVVTDYD